jgi:Zn-dependent M16 (insulinase) family peptidase
MDAVFYPNIYKKEEIFKQEGWHYELENEEADLKINGIVYNEMKGAFSSPEQVLFRLIKKSLFPDTPYGTESGGDPEYIPDLSYQEFLDFHKKYYHPVNSYIYLYGDMDIEEKLEWLDKEYLCNFEQIEVDSNINVQKPFTETKEVTANYPIAETESVKENTYLSYNVVIGTTLDERLVMSLKILEFVLLSTPGAPLKQALLDAKIGQDVLSDYDSSIMQPMFSIVSKNAEVEDKERFLQVIKSTLERIAKDGVNEKALRAAINYYEFKYREADFGQYPKGLMYGLQLLESWLYDDRKPFIHVKANDTFAFLKEQIGTGYFEKLILEHLLDNKHASVVIVKPETGLSAKMEAEVIKRLAEYKAGLSKEEIERLIADTKALEVFQDTPSTKEELEAIPLLEREDIGTQAHPVNNVEIPFKETKVLHHNYFTNGIGYVRALFDARYVPNSLVSYVGLLSTVLGYVDTKNFSFLELSNEINIHTGGINTFISTYVNRSDYTAYKPVLAFRVKVLYEKMPIAFNLLNEIIHETKLDDEKRMYEILLEIKSRLQMKLNSSGHSVAVSRATSYYSQAAMFEEMTSGIYFYRFIEDLVANFDAKKVEIKENLQKVMDCLFRKDTLLLSITADEEGYQSFSKQVDSFTSQLADQAINTSLEKFECKKLNEGFKTASKVQYVAKTGNYRKEGFNYTGSIRILKTILNFDYLWNNVRVKGGAYGAFCGFSYDGNGYFASYRDPNLAETSRIYDQVGDYVAKFDVDERDMMKYIIGTISGIDTPLNPAAKGGRSLSSYLSGLTTEDYQKERDEILSTTKEDIRALADLVASVTKENNICVIGNETKLKENERMFGEIKSLI